MPRKPNIVLSIARNAKSIGITFSIPSINLYVLLSSDFTTIRISWLLYSKCMCRWLRSALQDPIKKNFCFTFFVSHIIFNSILQQDQLEECKFYMIQYSCSTNQVLNNMVTSSNQPNTYLLQADQQQQTNHRQHR